MPGDWNGFFGLFTNVALNVIVLTGLCLGVVKMPDGIVFGRVLPALGIALPIGNLFYACLAWQLAKREGREDVTALPYGPSVPHMFIVVFLVMLPTYLKTNDPILAWQAGLAWAFIIGIIILLGAFVGPTIRKYTPRAAMLGALAGISIAFISMRPAAFLSWQAPWLAFISLGIILVCWCARVRLPWGLPGGLAAVLVGTVLAWIVTLTGISQVMRPACGRLRVAQVRPPRADAIRGLPRADLRDIGPLLVVAVPLGVYNFTEGMNNVESASAAGDNFDLRKVLLADGIGALAGAVLGSPFPPAVYIGHPGWKSVGGRVGYSLATGVVIALVCFLGLTALLLAVVPLVSILPILLYIGLVIGAQAFETTPARACASGDPRDAAEHRILGAKPDRRRAGAAGTIGSERRLRQAGGQRRDLSRAATVRWRWHVGGVDSGRDRRVHHRPKIRSSRALCCSRRRAGVLRLYPRHIAGGWQFRAGGAGLSVPRVDVRRAKPLSRRCRSLPHGCRRDARGEPGGMTGEQRELRRMGITRRNLIAASLAAPAVMRARTAAADTVVIRMGALKLIHSITPYFYERFLPDGYRLEIIPFESPTDGKSAVVTKSVDFGTFGIAAAILGAAAHEPVVVFGSECNKGMAVVARKDSPIASLKDLKGKRVAIWPGSTQEVFILERLHMEGMTIKDVESVRVSFSEMPAALARGDVDAYVGAEPGPAPVIGNRRRQGR